MRHRMISSIFSFSWGKPWILVFASFALLELSLRFSFFGVPAFFRWAQYSPRSITYMDYIEKTQDSVLKWKLKSNINGFIKGAGFKTNSLGFRDDEFTQTQQIVTLGRSITLGEGVEFESIWPQRVEKNLIFNNHRLSNVQNLAVSAYSLLQVERNFDLYGRKLEPSIVILPLFIEEWNAPIISENHTADFSIWNAFDLRPQLTHFFSFFAINQWQKQNLGPFVKSDWSFIGTQKWKDYPSLQSELPRIVFSIKKSADRIVLLNLPSNERVSVSERSKNLAILTNWAKRYDYIDLIDASDIVADRQRYPTIFYGDLHPNHETHKKIADRVYAELNSKKRLQ